MPLFNRASYKSQIDLSLFSQSAMLMPSEGNKNFPDAELNVSCKVCFANGIPIGLVGKGSLPTIANLIGFSSSE